mgnify:CR=1 FL=1
MIKEKYYTPELQEFHFGFEHEHYDFVTKIWNKVVIGSDFKAFQDLEKTLQTRRVKLLDKEDLQCLGWTVDYLYQSNPLLIAEFKVSTNESVHLREDQSGAFQISLYFKSDVKQYEQEWSKQGSILFLGRIKNKSEMKKLMQQLGIKSLL